MRRIVLVFVSCLLAATGAVQAQTCPRVGADTVQGGFTVNLGERFCVGSNIALTNSANVQSAQYWHEYTGTALPTTGGTATPTFRYTRPGKFLVIQRGKLNGREAYACRVVEVLPQPSPVFTVVSCAPGEGVLTIPQDPANPYEEYVLNWGVAGQAPVTLSRTSTPIRYTFPSSTTPYTISVRGNYAPGGCGATSGQAFRANGIPPSPQRADLTRLELTGPATATLTLSTFRNGSIEVFQRPAGGTFQTTGEKLATSTASNVVSLKNLNNQTQTCFKATFTDACQRTQDSPELCSLPLRVTAQNQQNQVEWTALPTPPTGAAFLGYTLRRNGAALPPVVTAIGATQRTDAPVRCGETYAYQLTARIGAMESVSEVKTVRGISTVTPPALTAFSSTITNETVNLTWTAPPAGTPPNDGIRRYTLTRSEGGAAFEPLVDSLVGTATGFADRNAQPASQTYCYVLSYTDVCGNRSLPSAPTCPVLLRQARGELEWTPYQTFGPATTYTVEEVSAAGQPLGSQAVGSALRYEPDPNLLSGQQVRFRIRASGTGPGQVSFSNVIPYSLALRVVVPEAFSPNGDGINDAFEVKGLFIQDYKLQVFNRWGEPVFASQDRAEGWNGQLNGTPAPEGWYAYQLDVTDFRGTPFQKRGGFLLTR